MVITRDTSVGPLTSSVLPLREQHARLRQLRHELIDRYRPHIHEGAGPIRVMARVVAELQRECRKLNISEEVMRTEIVNRTIGDVNLRLVTEYEGEPLFCCDDRLLADEL